MGPAAISFEARPGEFVIDFKWLPRMDAVGAWALINFRLESFIDAGLYGKFVSFSFPYMLYRTFFLCLLNFDEKELIDGEFVYV